jgi:hypothetical protein
MKFEKLKGLILQTHLSFQQQAVKAINRTLTLRNWLIGCYIVEFEQHGEDRAQYGDSLIDNLGNTIGISGLGSRNLKLFRQFYLLYPQIVQTLSAQSYISENESLAIVQAVSAQFDSGKLLIHERQYDPGRVCNRQHRQSPVCF